MLDSHNAKNKDKRGISILLTTVLVSTALFLVFGTVKFLEMTELSLRLTYVAMQTVQKGRLQIPSEELALESMAVVARLNGFTDAKPVKTLQKLKEGAVKFNYETPFSTTPLVRAYYTEGSGLLNGMFRGFSSSNDPGISAEQAQSGMAGGISNGATLVYADLSDSMKGPELKYDSGINSRISDLLHAFSLNVIEGARDGGATCPTGTDPCYEPVWGISTANYANMCWPIDISDCLSSSAAYLSNRPYTKARQCCNAARQNLPGYIGGTVVPPGRPYRPGWTIGSIPIDVDYQTNLPLVPYNPGLPADWQDDPSDNHPPFVSQNQLRLVCNTSVYHLDETITIPAGQPSAGTYGPFPNYPGFRVGDFDLSTCVNGGGCDRFKDAPPASTLTDRFTNDKITDRLLCVEPWHYWADWRLYRETAPWVDPGAASEIASTGGFSSQLGLLSQLASDFFITYKRLTEAFLIGISDFNSNLVFSVFGGANPFGAIQSTGSNPQNFMSGNYQLYNGFDAINDIEHEPIDITNTLTAEVPNSGSPVQRIWTSMNLLTGYYRTRLITHLDQAHFSNLNPGDNTPYPFSSHIWPGSEYLMALKNPKINSRNKGESVPWGLESDLLSPAHVASYFNFFTVDLAFGTTPVDMFPNGPRAVTFFPGYNLSPRFLSGGSHDLTWWPLKNVVNGVQTSQNLAVPEVLTYARELFGQALGPMMGGTHVRSVIKHMNDQADLHAAETGGLNGRRWFSIIISDGKPNEPAANTDSLTAAYPSLMIPTPRLQPIPAPNYNDMLTDIENGLISFEGKVPALSILLFIEHSPPDAETTQFLRLFDPATNGNNYKRALFKINYQNVEDFKEKYKQALTFISILLKSSTKFVQ